MTIIHNSSQDGTIMKTQNDTDACRERVSRVKSQFMTADDLKKLYEHLVRTSDLSPESIAHEIESVAAKIDAGNYGYFVRDIEELSLKTEEIAFLIEHNRYQEKEHVDAAGAYKNIDVHGSFINKHLYLISDTTELVRKTIDAIERVIRDRRGDRFRLYSYLIEFKAEKSDIRRLYILEHERPVPLTAGEGDAAVACILNALRGHTPAASAEDIRDFIMSCPRGFVTRGLCNSGRWIIDNYFFPWLNVRGLIRKEEDLYIAILPGVDEGPAGEKMVRLWLPIEKFQENFGTINRIFERRGIAINRQYFETFGFRERLFIALTTCIDAAQLTADVEEFLKGELYNRLILLQSAPVSLGEIRGILDRIRTARDYEKLDMIEEMQKNKQKEYLIPLVFLLNDGNHDIREKSFGLIMHYLLNPTAEMKNDYYWSTLKNIVTASTVPLEREMDRPARPLTDAEIINLVKFRDIYYEDYREPLTGGVYLFIRINGIGIGKGGIRADAEHVSFSGEGALSTNMLFKTLGVGIPLYAAAKGGILGDLQLKGLPAAERDQARENILNAYTDFLYYKAGTGPLSDVPAGDVGIGADEIGIIFNRITDNAGRDLKSIDEGVSTPQSPEGRILKENFGINCDSVTLVRELASDRNKLEAFTAASITGKPGARGLRIRAGATGRGLVEVLAMQQNYGDYNDASLWADPEKVGDAILSDEEFYRMAHRRIRMLTFSVQGFGKVGASFAGIIDRIGGKIKMISDISGTLVNEQGIPGIAELHELCRGGKCRLADGPREIISRSEFFPEDTIRPLAAVVNVVVPSALEDVVVNRDIVSNGTVNVKSVEGEYVLQGANGPVTSDAEDVLMEMGRISFPDILANSGGVLASYLEWLNGLIQVFGYGRMHREGFVHPIVHNLICRFHPGAEVDDLKQVDEEVYDYAFKFILRCATTETIHLSRTYKISMRTAYMALGMRLAAREGRLSGYFRIKIENMRDTFAAGDEVRKRSAVVCCR